MVKVLGLIVLSVLTNTAFVYFRISFVQSENAFSTISSIIGALTSFIVGIYLPIGIFPSAIQTLVKLLPVSHPAAFLRQVMIEDALKTVFKEAPASARQEFKQVMGTRFSRIGLH